MTIELYRSDPYRSEFVAGVVSCQGDWVTLDQTCFWPQDAELGECDGGRIRDHEVMAVRRSAQSEIQHLIAKPAHSPVPQVGTQLVCVIDWDRRYRRMRCHTAQHLVELAVRDTHDVAGLKLLPVGERARLSFVLASGEFEMTTVLRWVADVVSDDLPMCVDNDGLGDQAPTWHLDGYGHRPCRGLHVWSTGEVGPVNLHKAGERGVRVELELEVGELARHRVRQR